MKTLMTTMACLWLAAALLPSASARELLDDDIEPGFKIVGSPGSGTGGGGGNGTAGGSCHGPNPPHKCLSHHCDPENPDQSAYCHEQYCLANPDAYTCNNESVCNDGFYGRDTDGDGKCDTDGDENDDDGDGVTDECDANPRTADDPVTNTLDPLLIPLYC